MLNLFIKFVVEFAFFTFEFPDNMDPASSTSGGSCSDVGEEKAVSILPEQDQMKTSQASPADDVSKSQPPLPNVSSALSVDAPPFESVWSNSSSSTKLSVFAPEFVPKSVTTPSDYGQQFYQVIRFNHLNC